MPELTMLERVEYRVAQKPGLLMGNPEGNPQMEFLMRFKEGRDSDTFSLPMLVDAFAPAIVELGALSFTVQLTVHVRAIPAPGWLACRVQSRFVFGGYHEEDLEIFDSKGKLVAQPANCGSSDRTERRRASENRETSLSSDGSPGRRLSGPTGISEPRSRRGSRVARVARDQAVPAQM